MTNKIAIITGGSRGIGAATAHTLSQQGWDLCISYRDKAIAAEALCTSIRQQGGNIIAVQADIGIEDDVLALFNRVDNELGRPTALINNAGIITPQSQLVDMDSTRLQRIMNINVIGSFLCAREAIKRMSIFRGGHGGTIVNLSSAAARIGSPNEFIDYAASKGAIDTLTLGLSKEVAEEGIRVNAVRPGLIETELHAYTGDIQRPQKLKNFIPMKRAGSAQDVANAIAWLISEEASYVTGSLLDVAGGR